MNPNVYKHTELASASGSPPRGGIRQASHGQTSPIEPMREFVDSSWRKPRLSPSLKSPDESSPICLRGSVATVPSRSLNPTSWRNVTFNYHFLEFPGIFQPLERFSENAFNGTPRSRDPFPDASSRQSVALTKLLTTKERSAFVSDRKF